MIGHDYAGQLMPATLQAHFERLDALAALVQQLANTREYVDGVVGGPRDFVSRPAQQTLAQARAGMALPTIAHRSHRKQSTINEHLLLAAIMGETLPIEHLVPLKIHRALDPGDANLRSSGIVGSHSWKYFFRFDCSRF